MANAQPSGSSSLHERQTIAESVSKQRVIEHQKDGLTRYVLLALEKAVVNETGSRRIEPDDANNETDEEVAKLWLESIYRTERMKSRIGREESEERRIIEALGRLDRDTTLRKRAKTVIKVVPELPSLYSMLNKASDLFVEHVKYGDYETARALAWYAYGPTMPSPEILSRAYDLVAYDSGLILQSKPMKGCPDLRILRKPTELRSMDDILALSLVELTDRTIHCLKNTQLYSDRKTLICSLGEFVAEIARCAFSLVPELRERVIESFVNYLDRDKLLLKMERNETLIKLLWGDEKRMSKWYENHILKTRSGLTNFLFGMMHSDYGQFEINGLRYLFGRWKYADEHEQAIPYYRRNALKIEKWLMKKDPYFRESVYMKDGVLVRREPPLQRACRLLLIILYVMIGIALTLVVTVNSTLRDAAGYIEVVSLVLVGMIGVGVTLWECLSSQSRPIRYAFHGFKEAHTIEDLMSVSYVDRIRRRKSKFEGPEIERFRKWLAGIGFGNNLPGIDVFFTGKDKYPLYDPKGIRVDDLSEVTLCDGYYLVRRPDEKARELLRHGDNLHVDNFVDGHAIIVSMNNRCEMRVGGD